MRIGTCGNEIYVAIYQGLYRLLDQYSYNDKENSISLKDYIESFQEKLSDFKSEYEGLKGLNIGENNNVMSYGSDCEGRNLRIKLNEQSEDTIVPGDEFTYLDIYNHEGNTWAQFITKYGYSGKVVPLRSVDKATLNGCLDVFFKYRKLFELYLRQFTTSGLTRVNVMKGTKSELSINFDAINGSLINGLSGVDISATIVHISGLCVGLNIYINLTDGLEIDTSKCHVELNGNEVNIPDFDYEDLLSKILINRKLLLNYDLDTDENKLRLG